MNNPSPESVVLRLRQSVLHRLMCRAMLGAALAVVASGSFAASSIPADPLGVPAPQIDTRLPAPVIGVAHAGAALIAVGPHGLILRSMDSGASWQQMRSPVSSDLVQVRFSDERNGWIVGHDSVVLHSSDGGTNWKVQLDGRSLLTLLRKSYGSRARAGDQVGTDMLQEISMAMNTSATSTVLPQPFFDVIFDRQGRGFVAGAFGMLLRSDNAGETWEPWIDRTDNERRMHLYGLAEHAGTFYISGEQGLLMRLDPDGNHFSKVETPYDGTFFGVSAFDDLLLAYGLRGNLYVSRDHGQQWQRIETHLDASLVSVVDQGGELVVVSQSGQMIALDRKSLQASPLQPARGGEVYAASGTRTNGKLVVSRFSGAKVIDTTSAQ